jgi:hypothetical protein
VIESPRVKLEKGVFSKCPALHALIVPEKKRYTLMRLAKLGLLQQVTVIDRREADRALLYAELCEPSTEEARREEIRQLLAEPLEGEKARRK